jgi:peptidoglycan lytic transglycosylase G
VTGFAATALAVLAAACAPSGPSQRVPIPPGSTVRTAADSLAAHGIIRSPFFFRMRARLAGVDRDVRAGVYEFSPGESDARILRALRRGESVRFRLTLPEDGTLFDLGRAAQSELGIPSDSLLRAAADSALRARYGISAPTVEGWLEPDTYDFGGFDSATEVLTRLLDARRDTWDSTWDTRARALGLDRAGLLTLASIVEAESSDTSVLPTIAGVYRNRLRIGMALQADPTVEYAFALRDGVRKGPLHNKDYQIPSPWNTYLHPGLPPGPIGNPSRRAIEAVLAPATVPYLYFVADADGHYVFSRTYAQHLAAIAKIRRAQRGKSRQQP